MPELYIAWNWEEIDIKNDATIHFTSQEMIEMNWNYIRVGIVSGCDYN